MASQYASRLNNFAKFVILAYVVLALRPITHHLLTSKTESVNEGSDFALRYNEAMCLRTGVDPCKVFTKEAEHPFYDSFTSFSSRGTAPDGLPKRLLAAYTPWGYMFVMPFTAMHIYYALFVWQLVTFAVLVAAFRWARNFARRQNGDSENARNLACLGLAFYAFSFGSLVYFKNYAAIHLAAVLGMVWCLNANGSQAGQSRRKNILLQTGAGFCWALLMIKPQIGLLAAIPLLLWRKWIAIASAAAFCTAGTVPPMLLSGESFWNLATGYTANGIAYYRGTLLMPVFFARLPFVGGLPAGIQMGMSMALGALVCAVLSWRVRNCADWTVRVAPWLAVAPAWAYGYDHDTFVWLLPVMLFVCDSFRAKRRASRKPVLCFALFLCLTWYWGANHFLVNFNLPLKILNGFSIITDPQLEKSLDWIGAFGYNASMSKGYGLYWAVLAAFAVWLWQYANRAKPRQTTI